MKHILIVSATPFEIKPLLDYLEIKNPVLGMNLPLKQTSNKEINVLITGVGMVNTSLMVGRYSLTPFDLALNVGVCGSFDKLSELGELVNITNDVLSEMGAEDGEDFITYDKLNLGSTHQFASNFNSSNTQINSLKKVKGITVNTIHGNELSIQKIKNIYNPDVESMEGAAFFAGCSATKQFLQIRAISNYVEKRDKSKWKMELAINNLNDFLIQFLSENN